MKPIPVQLWNWGIKNRSGKLTYHSPEIIKMNLLPQGLATVTEKGIRFKKMHYICDRAITESWFSTANIKGSWKVGVVYDPRNMTNIYLLSKNGMSYEICRLLDYEERYMNMSEEEINYLLEYEQLQQRKYEHTELSEEINKINQIESTVSLAVQWANDQQSKVISKRQKVSSIQEYRAAEKEQLREKEQFNFVRREEKAVFNRELAKEEEKSTEQEYRRKSIKEILKQNEIRDQEHG